MFWVCKLLGYLSDSLDPEVKKAVGSVTYSTLPTTYMYRPFCFGDPCRFRVQGCSCYAENPAIGISPKSNVGSGA